VMVICQPTTKTPISTMRDNVESQDGHPMHDKLGLLTEFETFGIGRETARSYMLYVVCLVSIRQCDGNTMCGKMLVSSLKDLIAFSA
jgi:hypothetical protein